MDGSVASNLTTFPRGSKYVRCKRLAFVKIAPVVPLDITMNKRIVKWAPKLNSMINESCP
jgi:hypothetical protein